MEKIYLSDYELKVFMARRFSNLFFAMLPLVKEEEGGRILAEYKQKFSGKSEPVMISNIALAAWKDKIKSGKCKRILLADDIVVHGRTLNEVYCQLKRWFEEADIKDYKIDVFAYAESEQGLLENMESLKNRKVQKICSEGEWRLISDRIVGSLYLLGQPYTSYVPNMRIEGDSEFGRYIKELLADKNAGFSKQENAELQMYNTNTYIYVSSLEHEPALNFSVRIYEYVDLNEYVFVPMVMLEPVNLQVLREYLKEVSSLIYGLCAEPITDEEEEGISYRLAVYLVSALRGWKYIRESLQFQGQLPAYDKKEEEINFSAVILKEGMECLEESKLDELWGKLCGIYKSAEKIDDIFLGENDIVDLNNEFNDIWKETRNSGNLDRFFGKFLYVNGQLDEQRCQEESEFSQRFMGYPMAMAAKKMKLWNAENWVRAVLNAIDYGKGSIISKVVKGYCFSVLHAGEQNCKYYLNEYFPFLYGLNYIESYARRNGWTSGECGQKRKAYLKKYRGYWKEIGRVCFDSDIVEMERMPVSEKYSEVLENMAWNYFGDETCKEGIRIAKEIIGAKDKIGADELSTNL
ncbi:MAG: hypothetical protein HFH37_06910 [Lachnospiraceae bacterium]|nr:hypothetical protein [Lachnospiraceae bacterium]